MLFGFVLTINELVVVRGDPFARVLNQDRAVIFDLLCRQQGDPSPAGRILSVMWPLPFLVRRATVGLSVTAVAL